MANYFYIGLFLTSIVSSVSTQSVTLYADINFRGESKEISVSGGDCKNVLDWNDKASSIRMGDTECVVLYEHINCGGRSVQLRKNSEHLDNFVGLNFNDELTSLKTCGGTDNGGNPDLCLAEHNVVRARHGLPPFESNAAIARASQIHIEREVRENCHEGGKNPHQCPGEKPLGDRLKDEGYIWSSVGENWNQGSGDCKSAVELSWMESKGHRENILRDYKHVGCGMKDNSWSCAYASPA